MLRRKEIKKTQSKKSAWQKTIHKTNSDFSIIQKRRNNHITFNAEQSDSYGYKENDRADKTETEKATFWTAVRI